METNVTVVVRSKDKSIIQKASEGAKGQYREISGRDVNISVSGELSDTMYVLLNDLFEITIINLLHKCGWYNNSVWRQADHDKQHPG